jgi:hypothetical protein
MSKRYLYIYNGLDKKNFIANFGPTRGKQAQVRGWGGLFFWGGSACEGGI